MGFVAVELGTCLGISAAYQGYALALNQKGKLITIEGADSLARISAENLKFLKIDTVKVVNGKFNDVLPDILKTNRPVDYAFIDGHHDQMATIAYFELIVPFLSEKAVLVFDDISWSPGMKKAWEQIINDPKVNIGIDLGDVGICVLNKTSVTKQLFYLNE